MDDATPEPLAIDEAIDDLAPISDDDEIELEVADNQSFQKVAELSIEEKSEKLKEFWNDCWNIHQVGDYIDAQDTYQKWMLAKIISLDNYYVEIRFDGWPAKWDLRYPWTSSKIVPVRLRSHGYTGQPKAPLRPKYWFDEEQLAQEKILLETMIERDFERYTARDLSQFLRARFFVYNDFLMTATHKDLTQEQQDMIDQYFKSAMRLIAAWTKKIPSIMHRSHNTLFKNPELFLVDEDVALLECQTELFATLKTIFCGCHRNLRIYAYYDRNMESFEQDKVITNSEHTERDFEKERHLPDDDYNAVSM